MVGFNENRSRQDAEKILLGMKRKVQEGWYPTGVPFGYRNIREVISGEKNRAWIEVNEKEAHWVQRAFMLYGIGKYTLRGLADFLSKEGFPTRNGKPLHASTLEKILKNKFYIGVIEWGGITNPNGKHPPLIEPALFEKVQAIFNVRNEGTNRQRKHWFLLRGLAFCGECGSRITGEDHPMKGKRYYRCQKMQKNKRIECHQKMIPESDLNNQFAELFKMVQLPDSFVEKLRNKIRVIFEKESAIYEKSRKSLLSQIDNMQNRQKVLLEKLLDKTINDELYEITSKEQQEKEK
jgi:site-specific DNA recombinase